MNIRKNPNQPATPASPYQPSKSKDKGKAPKGGVTKPAGSDKSKNKDNIPDAIKNRTPSKAVQTRSPAFAQRKMDAIDYYTQPTTDETTRRQLAVYIGVPYIESFAKRLTQAEKELNTVIAQNEQIAREAIPDQNDEAHQALRAQLFEDASQDIELSEDASQDIQMGEDHGQQIEQDRDEVMHEQQEAGDGDAPMNEDYEANDVPENFEYQGAQQEGAADAATQIQKLTEKLAALIKERDEVLAKLNQNIWNHERGVQEGKQASAEELNILRDKLQSMSNSVEAEAKRVAVSIANIKKELDQSKAELIEANTQINTLKKDLENSKTKIEALNTELSQATKPEEQKTIQAKLEQAQAELDNAKLASDSLEIELREALVNLKKNQTEKTNLEVKLNRTKSKLNDFKFRYTRAEVRFEKARKHWEDIGKGLEVETSSAKKELAEAQASWEEAKTNYEEAQESYAIDLKDLENQLRKTKFELATKVPMAIKAGGQRGLEIGEKRGIKRGRAEAKDEMERATKIRKAIATTFSAGIGAVLLGNPLAQTAIENFTQNAFAFATRRGFQFATETIINTVDVLPPTAAILGTAGLAGLAYGLSSWSVSDLTSKTK